MSLIPIVQGGHSSASAFDSTLIGNSVWFDGSADHLIRSTSSHSSNEVVMACWFQRTSFSDSIRGIMSIGSDANVGSTNTGIWLASNDTLYFYNNGHGVVTNQLFRDIGWYHICASYKLDETTASNKGKLFINGEEVTSFSADPRSSWGTSFGSTANQTVGVIFGVNHYDGYIAQPVMLDGQSIQGGDVAITDFVDTFTFGTNGSQIIPKKDSDIAALATSAGGNSFCLDFANSSDLGNDISSNNNDFTPTSMSSANQSINTPSKVYPTMNPLNDVATVVLSEGNTRVNAQSSASIRSTAFAAAGKRYAEVTVTAVGNSYLGVAVNGTNPTSFAATGVVACQQDGDIYVSSSSPSGNKCPAYTTGDVLGILIDVDADKFWVSKNGTFHSMDRNPTITLTAEQVLAGTGGFDLTALGSDGSYGIHVGNSDGTSADVSVNFGQDSYTHTPPTGYISWASDNFDAPAFQGIDHFNVVLYTGNGTAIGSGGKAVTGTGFQPDLVWIKNRDATDSYALYDVARGTTKQLEADTAAAESTESEGLTTFGTDGFTVGNLAQVNTSSEDYVAWQWLAGGSAISNTQGSLASSVSVSPAGNFSVGTYSGASGAQTVGHGLSAAPDMLIVKGRNVADSWRVFHTDLGNTRILSLNLSNVGASSSIYWNNDGPTSTTFTVATDASVNGSGNNYVFLAFRSIPGVCKVGSYEGNGASGDPNADGTYISMGFKPRWVMVKVVDSGTGSDGNWTIFDTARQPFNSSTFSPTFFADDPNPTAGPERSNSHPMDILSDGVKFRDNSFQTNSARTYIYLAMADIAGGQNLPPIYGR